MFVVYFSQECDFTHNNRSDILYDSLLKYHIKLYSFTQLHFQSFKKFQRMGVLKKILTFDTSQHHTLECSNKPDSQYCNLLHA